MTPQEAEISQFKLDRIVRTLEDSRPILKTFMSSMNGINSNGRESLMAFTILERIYYNIVSASPLAKDLAFNQNVAIPISHIFRSIIYEVVIAYWLLEKDYANRVAMLNKDFIKKGYNKIRQDIPPVGDDKIQTLFAGWETYAPENFSRTTSGEIIINENVKSITFTNICKSLSDSGHNLGPLMSAYTVLSQQAHLTEFSRPLIYDKYSNNINLFDFVTWSAIYTSTMLVEKINPSSEAIKNLRELSLFHYSDYESRQAKIPPTP
jgi:hypothetical protein